MNNRERAWVGLSQGSTGQEGSRLSVIWGSDPAEVLCCSPIGLVVFCSRLRNKE